MLMLPISGDFIQTRFQETGNNKYQPPWTDREQIEIQNEFRNAQNFGWYVTTDRMRMKEKIYTVIRTIFSHHLLHSPEIHYVEDCAIFRTNFKCTFLKEGVRMGFTFTGLDREDLELSFVRRVIRYFCVYEPIKELMNFLFPLVSVYNIPFFFLKPLFSDYITHPNNDYNEHRIHMLQTAQERLERDGESGHNYSYRLILGRLLPKLKSQQYEQCEKHMTYFRLLCQAENVLLLKGYVGEVLLMDDKSRYFHSVIPFSKAEQVGYYLGHKDSSYRNLLSLFFGNRVCPMMDALGEDLPPEVTERIGLFIAALCLLDESL